MSRLAASPWQPIVSVILAPFGSEPFNDHSFQAMGMDELSLYDSPWAKSIDVIRGQGLPETSSPNMLISAPCSTARRTRSP